MESEPIHLKNTGVTVADVFGPSHRNEFLELISATCTDASKPQLNRATIQTISQQAGSRPVSVISIYGPMDQGKCCLLDYLVRRFDALEKGETNVSSDVGELFKLQAGAQHVTHGILIWGRPFILKNATGEEVAVLLIDARSSNENTDLLLGPSLLASSVTVMNLCTYLQKEVLESLNNYACNYGELLQHKACENAPFQKISLLIEDQKSPTVYSFGGQVGKKILEEKLAEDGIPSQCSSEAKQFSQYLAWKSFKDVDCVLIPKMCAKIFTRNSTKFAKCMESLLNSLIYNSSTNMCTVLTKKTLGYEVTAQDLFAYLESYLNLFNSTEDFTGMPFAVSLWETTYKIHSRLHVPDTCLKLMRMFEMKLLDGKLKVELQSALEKVQREVDLSQKRMKTMVAQEFENYGNQMKAVMSTSDFLSEESFMAQHERVIANALREFEKTELPDNADKFKLELKEKIEQKFEALKAENVAKQEHAREKARNCVNSCQRGYLKMMHSELGTAHRNASELLKQVFLVKCPAKDHPVFVNEYQNELQQRMDKTLKNLTSDLAEMGPSYKNRQNKIAQLLVEECCEEAFEKIITQFPATLKEWIDSQLDPESIEMMGAIYEDYLRETTSGFRDIISPKLWQDFVKRVDTRCRTECLKVLSKVIDSVIKIDKFLQELCQFSEVTLVLTPCDLEQLVNDNVLRGLLTSINGEKILEEIVLFACHHLTNIYERKSGKYVIDGTLNNVVREYNHKMEGELKKEIPHSSDALKQIHLKLVEIAIRDFERVCSVWNMRSTLVKAVKSCRRDIDVIYRSLEFRNDARWATIRLKAHNIKETMTKQYQDKVWEILNKMDEDGSKITKETANKWLESEKMKILKLLEMEIRQKISSELPVEGYKQSLQAYMEFYWPECVKLNSSRKKK